MKFGILGHGRAPMPLLNLLQLWPGEALLPMTMCLLPEVLVLLLLLACWQRLGGAELLERRPVFCAYYAGEYGGADNPTLEDALKTFTIKKW